jgi:transcriptional antiterminator NusG
MQDNNKKPIQTNDLPEEVVATSDETPIEVPNDATSHPQEVEVAKESLPAEEFKAEEKTEEAQDISEPTPEPVAEDKEIIEDEIKEDEDEEEIKEKVEPQEKYNLSETGKNQNPNAKWYIVHTYSGHENKVAKSLKQRIQSLGFEDRIFDIIVPMRNTIKVSQGKKESVKEKIFPGYVLVKMVLDDESWLLVRTTQGVTAFIGAGNKPTPISDKEVEAIQKFMNADEPLYKTSFSVGEAVKITDGPFNDFLGTIDAIDEARGKLKVLVSIFGRETPVELDFLQVKKL